MKYAGASIERRRCRQVQVGSVPVGGDAPISVQTMTNTDTLDVASTLRQIDRIQAAGADMVRVSVPSLEAAESFRQIRSGTRIPLIADVHFDYRIALRVIELGADCLRINPGNIGRRQRIAEVVGAAADAGTVLRIGVNAGSLEKDLQAKYGEPCPDALVESAMRQVDILDELGFDSYKLSIKASEVFMAVESYRRIARQIDAPLHLGITEAGAARAGTVKSAIGLGVLLMEGIGDTLRISLAADPVEEVKVGFELLKSLHLRTRGVNIIACPSCSRQNFDVIATVNELERRLEDITDPLELAVIGCYVNGPGESRAADIGVTGADPRHLMYVGGEPSAKLGTGELIDRLEAEVRARIEQNRREKTSGGDIPVQQQ